MKIISAAIIVIVLLAGILIFWRTLREPGPAEITISANMKISSPAFENNRIIPSRYTCDGENISPPLEIAGVPQGAKSLVLIVDDPDAPSGTWDHWLVWNISPSVSVIEENRLPLGAIEGLNSFGEASYGGPCPPGGVHHYHFKLYALSRVLNLDSSSGKRELEKTMENSIIDKAELVGLYRR